jgi:anti-anti-sigma regulatory factor
MMRVHIDTGPDGVTLRIEGRLAGPSVDELARCWASMSVAKNIPSIHVDLDGVTFIGSAGKALLRKIRDDGAVLLARDCMTRAIIEEITRRGPT